MVAVGKRSLCGGVGGDKVGQREGERDREMRWGANTAAPASVCPSAQRKAWIELKKRRWKGGRNGGGEADWGPTRGSGYRKQKWPGDYEGGEASGTLGLSRV